MHHVSANDRRTPLLTRSMRCSTLRYWRAGIRHPEVPARRHDLQTCAKPLGGLVVAAARRHSDVGTGADQRVGRRHGVRQPDDATDPGRTDPPCACRRPSQRTICRRRLGWHVPCARRAGRDVAGDVPAPDPGLAPSGAQRASTRSHRGWHGHRGHDDAVCHQARSEYMRPAVAGGRGITGRQCTRRGRRPSPGWCARDSRLARVDTRRGIAQDGAADTDGTHRFPGPVRAVWRRTWHDIACTKRQRR